MHAHLSNHKVYFKWVRIISQIFFFFFLTSSFCQFRDPIMAIVDTCCQGISIYGAQVCCDAFGRPSNNSINILLHKVEKRKAKAAAPSPKCMLHFCIEFHIFFGSCNIKSGNILTWQTPGRNLQAIDTLFPSWQADGNPRLVYKGNFNKSSLSTSPCGPLLYTVWIYEYFCIARNQIIFYIFFRGDDFPFFLGLLHGWLTASISQTHTHTRIFSHSHTRVNR